MYGKSTNLCNFFVSPQWCKVRVLSARSVKSSRNGVIALPKRLNFISAFLSAKVWYGVLELSVTLEAYAYIALS